MKVSSPALRYHGGKFRMAPWVTSFFPAHTVYVEPFGGAASVLLHKRPSYAEVYNDLDGDVVNFFRVLRDPAMREKLTEACVLTPYARDEFDLAYEHSDDPVERARRLAVRASMGFGSAGATKGGTGFRVDTQRKYSTAQHVWARYPDSLAPIGHRLAGVLIENRPAVDVMLQHDSPETLHYADPPYVMSTRDPRAIKGQSSYYRHEMTDDDHVELIRVLRQLRGHVILSGYDCELYRDLLTDWEVHQTAARISAGRGTTLRMETLWLSPSCTEALRRPRAQTQLNLDAGVTC